MPAWQGTPSMCYAAAGNKATLSLTGSTVIRVIGSRSRPETREGWESAWPVGYIRVCRPLPHSHR